MNTMTVRFLGVAAACLSLVACGGVDAQKFDAIYKAGKALQAEVQSSGNTPRLEARDRLKEFETAINALQGHTIGIKEADALHAYDEAADGYRQFLRFRAMETEEGTNQIALKGAPILEVATRYKLPVDSRGGSKYVNRAQAVTILLQAAEQHLADGNRFIGRQ